MLQIAFGVSSINWASVLKWHKKSRESWGMMRGVRGVRKSEYKSWLAKVLGSGLLCWGFKGVQEEIPSEEDSILQIESVAFPRGQCISPQLHSCHRLFTKMGMKTDPQPLYSPELAPGDFCFFPKPVGCRYETIKEMKEALTKVIDTLTQEDFPGSLQKLLELFN